MKLLRTPYSFAATQSRAKAIDARLNFYSAADKDSGINHGNESDYLMHLAADKPVLESFGCKKRGIARDGPDWRRNLKSTHRYQRH